MELSFKLNKIVLIPNKPEKVHINVDVLPTKYVPVKYQLVGTVADGYGVVEDAVSCDIMTVLIAGETEELRNVKEIIIASEELDITEVHGADALYETDGIIAESERNATELFETAYTLYSTEGSSQCIRAMLYLALLCKKEGTRPVIVAARNVHKAFVYAATLLDFDVIWLWPEETSESICSCPVSPKAVETILQENKNVVAVYITSPDYLGGQADIKEIAEVLNVNYTYFKDQ